MYTKVYAYQFAKKIILINESSIFRYDSELSTANYIQQKLYAPKYHVKAFMAFNFLIQLNFYFAVIVKSFVYHQVQHVVKVSIHRSMQLFIDEKKLTQLIWGSI